MIDKKAYTQAYKLIEIMPDELKKKIPDTVIIAIKNNMDNSYKFEMDDENIEEIDLLDDTEKILSVIYTDYLATDEEREIIKAKEKTIIANNEEEKKAGYKQDYYNFPKQENNQDINVQQKNKVMKMPEQKWYKRFIERIKEIINK